MREKPESLVNRVVVIKGEHKHIFHRSNGECVKDLPEDRLKLDWLETADVAIQAGYSPCAKCYG